MAYLLVTDHPWGPMSKSYPTWEQAKAAALDPDQDPTIVPNLSQHIIDAYLAEGMEYSSGLFWLRVNRYGVIFNTDPEPQ